MRMSVLKRYWFMFALLVVLWLAVFWPEGGRQGGLFGSPFSSRVAVFIIFIFQGLMMRTNEVLGGLVRWRFHLLLQGYIFVLCPILFLLITWVFDGVLSGDAQIGIWFLGALPTTIATSLMFATRAGGRQIETITNIVLANSLAVFVTPAWMYFLLSKQTDSLDLSAVIGKLAVLILLPLFIGVILRKWCAHRADQKIGLINNFNSTLILFIAYCAFAESAHAGAWSGDQSGDILVIGAITLVCLFLNMLMAYGIARVAGLNTPDRISFFFCGSFKSLATGVPMAMAIFEGNDELAIILLPLVCYAMAQFLFGGYLTAQWERRNTAAVVSAK